MLVVVVGVAGVPVLVVDVVQVPLMRDRLVPAACPVGVHVPVMLGVDEAVAVVDVVFVDVVGVPVVQEVDVVLVRDRGVAAGRSMEMRMLPVGLMRHGSFAWHRGHHMPPAGTVLG